MNPRLLPAENLARLFQCAMVCTQEKNTIDQATSLWKVMFLSNGMMSFKGVRRAMEIRFLQTGKRMKATSTCRVKAAERAMGNVKPNWFLAWIELSCGTSAMISRGEEGRFAPSAHNSACRT